ncbi:hypothetical protein B0H19DRAFT_1081610 [Mycena capillaripes]|nr:hypothetical protein B0H19DRAFT_1081610 [Mycena capillaripes]
MHGVLDVLAHSKLAPCRIARTPVESAPTSPRPFNVPRPLRPGAASLVHLEAQRRLYALRTPMTEQVDLRIAHAVPQDRNLRVEPNLKKIIRSKGIPEGIRIRPAKV